VSTPVLPYRLTSPDAVLRVGARSPPRPLPRSCRSSVEPQASSEGPAPIRAAGFAWELDPGGAPAGRREFGRLASRSHIVLAQSRTIASSRELG